MPQLQDVIDSRHFQELLAYDKLYGVPESWSETGQICATIANAMASRKDKKPWTPSDFIPAKPPKQVMKKGDVDGVIDAIKRRQYMSRKKR